MGFWRLSNFNLRFCKSCVECGTRKLALNNVLGIFFIFSFLFFFLVFFFSLISFLFINKKIKKFVVQGAWLLNNVVDMFGHFVSMMLCLFNRFYAVLICVLSVKSWIFLATDLDCFSCIGKTLLYQVAKKSK